MLAMATTEKSRRPRLAAAGKVKRDEAVIADRARGFGWSTVAERNGVSARQCQNIWRERQERTLLDVANPREELRDEIAFLDAAIEEYAKLSETTGNDSIRLGAIKARLEAQARRLELKRFCGLLPWDLGQVVSATATRLIVEELIAICEKHDVPEQVYKELAASLRQGYGQLSAKSSTRASVHALRPVEGRTTV
jgi:hypothetical protein